VIGKFYCLRHDDKYKPAEWDHAAMRVPQVLCTANPSHRRDAYQTDRLTITLESGRIGDFVNTWMSEWLITDRVRLIFEAEKVTGYSLGEVTISHTSKKGTEPTRTPVLHELKTLGWGGMATEASGIRLQFRCPNCGYSQYTGCTDPLRLIDEEAWDGSDIFMVWPLPKYVFITERIRDIIERDKLRGCKVDPISTLFNPEEWRSVLPGFSPGHLSDYMPIDRAHELGDPLGIF